MQFTFTITDSDDAERLEDDLRRDPRIYTRSKKANGQNNVVPVATQVEAEKQALLQTGTCAVLPEVPLPPPPPTQ